ncbi:styrene monooxygenase NADH-dependent flavin reductase subunit StyB [Solimonas soli]|uniref:styrene monooxygenase NADH-dependent flavin reductase subunit StyB n=1 Tax=Solimonas soli TaxID=413479 RepID=UPI000688DD74|nr:flavin reductase family protein [Solimonas soli]
MDDLENPMAGSVDPLHFRKTVSRFATGIAIIACEDEDGRVHGMVAKSFTSINLDPPTVLISMRPGKAHRAITRSGRFGASILNESQQGYLAHFSGTPQESFVPDFIVRSRTLTLRQCLAWFECEIVERIQIHDQTLFVAKVTQCDVLEGRPLMFYADRYHRRISVAERRYG